MNCPKCGAILNMADAFCQNCGCPINNQMGNNFIGTPNIQYQNEPLQKQTIQIKKTIPFHNDNENYVKGFLGAIIGSFAGIICMIILFNIGYFAAITGAVMAVCTIALYKKLAGGISKEGIIISVLVMIIAVFMAYNISVAIALKKELAIMGFKVGLFKVMLAIPDLMRQDYFPYKEYIAMPGLLYLFALIGAFGTIKKEISSL